LGVVVVVWLWGLLACRPPGAGAADPPKVVTIAAINDFHGALYESKPDAAGVVYGGLPWLAAAVRALRDDHPGLVLLDGGDLFQGSWPVNATKGIGSVEAFNLLGVDAAAVGNHEFDYGGTVDGHPLRGALEAAAGKARFAWLAANVVEVGPDGATAPWSPAGISPWTTIERDGVTIGVVGLLTTETPSVTLAKNVADLRFEDPVAAMRRVLPELQAAGADAVVVVGHLTGACASPGPACVPDGEIGRLLAELPVGSVDVIVAGHAHTELATRVGDTFVVEGRSSGRLINVIDLVVGADGVDADATRIRAPWVLNHAPSEPACGEGGYDDAAQDVGGRTLSPDLDALALVRALEGDVGSLCAPLGCADHRVTRAREAESALGNVVADAMRSAFSGADVAVVNSGGLRDELPSGTIRRQHVHDVMPFDNRLLLVAMTGAQLRLLYRLGSSGAHGVLQTSGATYAFDPARTDGTDLDGDGGIAPFEVDRLCDVRVAAAPIDPERVYKVVVSDFLYGGGDDLGLAFQGATVLEEGPLVRDRIGTWMSRRERCVDDPSPVVPERPRVAVGPCP
jgi:5'-nucleotidase